MSYKKDRRTKIEVRRSDPVFQAALRLGLPIEISENNDTALISAGRQAREQFTTPCMTYADDCWKKSHKIMMDLTKEAVALFTAGVISASAVNELGKAYEHWHEEVVKTLCRCGGPIPGSPPPPGPPKPDWKTKPVGPLPWSWEQQGKVAGDIAPVAATAAVFAISLSKFGVGAAGAAAATAAGWVPILGAVAAAAALTAAVLWLIANDPPDFNFTQIPVVVLPGRMQPEPDMTALPTSAQDAVNDVLDRIGEQIALSTALLAALERSWGAELSGQANERDAQLAAAADFGGQLATSLDQQFAARTRLVAEMRAAGLTITFDRELMAQVVVPTFSEGPTPEFISAVNHYGSGVLDPNTAWWICGAKLFDGDDFGAGVFPEMTNPPEVALAEARFAELLRSMRSVWT